MNIILSFFLFNPSTRYEIFYLALLHCTPSFSNLSCWQRSREGEYCICSCCSTLLFPSHWSSPGSRSALVVASPVVLRSYSSTRTGSWCSRGIRQIRHSGWFDPRLHLPVPWVLLSGFVLYIQYVYQGGSLQPQRKCKQNFLSRIVCSNVNYLLLIWLFAAVLFGLRFYFFWFHGFLLFPPLFSFSKNARCCKASQSPFFYTNYILSWWCQQHILDLQWCWIFWS